MTFGSILFVVWIALTLYNNGVQAYIHFEAYPLIAQVGKAEFAAYMGEYERRITIPLVAPYGLTVLSNLALIFIHSNALSLVGVIIALVVNLAVAATTMVVATPVYNRIKAAGQAAPADMSRLMSINLIRLLLSTLSSLIALLLLLTVLSA